MRLADLMEEVDAAENGACTCGVSAKGWRHHRPGCPYRVLEGCRMEIIRLRALRADAISAREEFYGFLIVTTLVLGLVAGLAYNGNWIMAVFLAVISLVTLGICKT